MSLELYVFIQRVKRFSVRIWPDVHQYSHKSPSFFPVTNPSQLTPSQHLSVTPSIYILVCKVVSSIDTVRPKWIRAFLLSAVRTTCIFHSPAFIQSLSCEEYKTLASHYVIFQLSVVLSVLGLDIILSFQRLTIYVPTSSKTYPHTSHKL
jgi:hypothetical protein